MTEAETHLFNVKDPEPDAPALDVIETLEPGRAYAIRRVPTELEAMALWPGAGEGRTFRGRTHVTNQRGRNVTTYLLHTEVCEVIEARRAVQELTGRANVGWTFSSLARQVTEWLDLADWRSHRPLMIPMPEALPTWHYQECTPADFPDCSLYDMRSAYWQIAMRARSPIFDLYVDKRRIYWRCISGDAEDRWRRMGEALEPHKRLRLAIIGVNACGWQTPGRWIEQRFYYRGEPQTMKFPPGPLQPLALLTVICAYELTQCQAKEAGALYANADCVIVEGQRQPEYWNNAGILYRLVARGKTDIHAMGAYRVGPKQTLPYELAHDLDLVNGHAPQLLARPDWHLCVYQ